MTEFTRSGCNLRQRSRNRAIMTGMSGNARANRPPDREATEAALQRAALELLERNGALAGLNLREVADEAGVNRGLVYHYFGSRQDLIRAALRSDVKERMAAVMPQRSGSAELPDRWCGFLASMSRHRRAVVLAALLILDGDAKVRMIPNHDVVRRRHEADIDEGWLRDDLDLDAVHVALVSTVYGYLVFRERLAEELGRDLDELDDGVADVFRRMLSGLTPDEPDGAPGRTTDDISPGGSAERSSGRGGHPARTPDADGEATDSAA
jgi:AcrR family transcriptional regulator